MSNLLPNILWLVSEGHKPFIHAYGERLARTPHLDAFAKKGLLYRNVFGNAPVYAPLHFAILTGVHPESCAPANHMRAIAKLPGVLRTWPEYLHEAGYYCTSNSKTDYNCNVDPERIYDVSGKQAHWKNRPPGKPFMAVLSNLAIHESSLVRPIAGRVQPEDVIIPIYLPDTPEIRQDYATCHNAMEKIDAQMGAWIKEVEEAGLADDTIIFYFSDSGGALPRSKRYCTDEGLRCELIVWIPPKWADLAPARMGTEIESPVSFVDLAPTVLSIAGIPTPPQMQGRPFLGKYAGPPREYAFGMRNRIDERYDFVRAVTDGRFHYVRNYMPHRVMGQHGAYEWLAGGYQSWEREYLAGRLNPIQARFFTEERSFEELYDLRRDPEQVNNLAGVGVHATRLRAMRKVLDQHMLSINDNGFIPEGMEMEGYIASRDRQAYPLQRLIEIGAAATQRDRANLPSLMRHLSDANAVVRYWAILGILMLGRHGAPARNRLAAMMRSDPIPQNRVAAAEAVATLAPSLEAVNLLSEILDTASSWPVQLQAINALTFLDGQAKTALPAIRRAAESEQEYLRNAGRYLVSKLEGYYALEKKAK